MLPAVVMMDRNRWKFLNDRYAERHSNFPVILYGVILQGRPYASFLRHEKVSDALFHALVAIIQIRAA